MDDLSSLKNRINEKETAISAEREREWIVLANLGQAVHDSGGGGALAEEFGKAVTRASEEIRNLEESLRTLLADDERRNQIAEERKTLNVELRNLKNKAQDEREELGRAAWDLWKSGRVVDGMEQALDSLVKAEGRLHAAEDAVYRNDRVGADGGGSILAKGRALFLAGRKKTASAALDRLWGSAGSQIIAAVDLENLQGTSAATPAATLKAIEERQSEIQNRFLALTDEKNRLDAALESMPGKGGLRRRSAFIEKALEEGRNNLDDAFRELGESWLDAGATQEIAPEVEERKAEWDEINGRIRQLEDEKSILDQHREYRELEFKKDKQESRVQSLDAELKNKQLQLKEAKKELNALEKDLGKVRDNLPPLPEEDQT